MPNVQKSDNLSIWVESGNLAGFCQSTRNPPQWGQIVNCRKYFLQFSNSAIQQFRVRGPPGSRVLCQNPATDRFPPKLPKCQISARVVNRIPIGNLSVLPKYKCQMCRNLTVCQYGWKTGICLDFAKVSGILQSVARS